MYWSVKLISALVIEEYILSRGMRRNAVIGFFGLFSVPLALFEAYLLGEFEHLLDPQIKGGAHVLLFRLS